MRLAVRLRWARNSFRECKAQYIGRKNVAGFVEALRSFGTSNDYLQRVPLQVEIVNALRMCKRSRASRLLSELGCGGQALQARDFISILQYCAREPDPLFVMETWKLMEENDIELNGNCYGLTIRSLCKGGYLKEAFKILRIQRESSDMYPTLQVYNSLLEACAHTNSLNHASECLDMMEQQGVGKDSITYNFLVQLAVLQQDISVVREIWKEYINYHSPSIMTLRKFIWSFTRLQDLQSAYAALQQLISVALQQKDNIIETCEGKLFDTSVNIPIPFHDDLARTRYEENICTSVPSSFAYFKERDSNKGLKSESVMKEVGADAISLPEQTFSGPVMKLLRWSVADIIHICAKSKNILLARKLMLQMQNLGLEPSSSIYDGFIRTLVARKGFHEAVEVVKVMQEKNMKPHNSTLAAISVIYSKGLELDLAETFLAQISKCPHTYPFNACLEACDTLDQPERAIGILARMKYLTVLPDIRTYELLFSLFGNVNAPYEDGDILSQNEVAKRISAIERDMARHGIEHSHTSMQNLLKALGMEGMTKEIIWYLRVAENHFFHRKKHLRIHTYNTVLYSLVDAKESHMATEVFKRMLSFGLSPDAATYNIMIDCCTIIRCYRSACALISMMIRDGFCPHTVTYTGLIKILVNNNDFDEALKLLDQANSDLIQCDLVLYNTILRAAKEQGRIDVIETIVEKMHQEEIQPDPSTCTHVFEAYAYNGFYSTATEALQVLSLRMISMDENVLEEKRLEYENLILDEDPGTESRIIEILKDSPYTGVALLYLRWCATLLFPISWSPNQSPWVKGLSQ